MSTAAIKVDSLTPPPVPELPTELRFLLGDPGRPNLPLSSWADDASNRLADNPESEWLTFELGCACLYDSRLEDAKEAFRIAPFPDARGLALLSLAKGKVFNLQGLSKTADYYLERAVTSLQTAKIGDPTVSIAACFYLLNRTDFGALSEADLILQQRITHAQLTAEAEAVRMHTVGRLMLRSGDKREALERLESYWNSLVKESISPFYRAQVARLMGVLFTLNGRPLSARHALREALELFRSIGYRRGIVRTGLSLARTYCSLDVAQAKFYVSMVGRILNEETDPPQRLRVGGRTMPLEWSDYFARSGDIAFASGQFGEAKEMYAQDVHTLDELRFGHPQALWRETAHAYRNLGRSLLALQHPETAAGHFAQSATLFEQAHDQMGTFYSLVHRCRAELKAHATAEAAKTLERLQQFIVRMADRPKEKAILQLLQANHTWLAHRDDAEPQRLIRLAKREFELRRDHYYLFALLLEAQIAAAIDNRPAARKLLAEAWRRSSSADMADIRQEVEGLLHTVGVRDKVARDETTLEQRCRKERNVHADLTILYADIRGFTDACTRIDAHQMASFITDFARLVSTCVARNDGLPVRFLGDCVMALFGAREEDASTSVRLALESAHEIYEFFVGLRDRWFEHTPELGAVGLGCGIATGTVVAGTFGAAGLSEFSVIGEPVNLASRIQGIAEDGQIMLCSKTTSLATQEIEVIGEPRRLVLKGLGERDVTLVSIADVAKTLRTREKLPPSRPRIRPLASVSRNR